MKPQVFFAAFALALALGSATLISTRLDNVAYANDEVGEAPIAYSETFIHRVQAGDTLYSISRAYFGDPSYWTLLAEINGISQPGELRAGDPLDIPRMHNVPLLKDVPSSELSEAATDAELQAKLDEYGSKGAEISASANWIKLRQNDKNVYARVIKDTDGNRLEIAQEVQGQLNTIASEVVNREWIDFRYAFASDSDGDGFEEINTVWKVGDDEHQRQVYAWKDGELSLGAIVPNDPIAFKYEMANRAEGH